jgi:hypothetical protein
VPGGDGGGTWRIPGGGGSLQGVTPPTNDFVTIVDPVENAYSLGMPKGWQNRTYTARILGAATYVDVTVSPNGSVVMFLGDPNLPQYFSPNGAGELEYSMARMSSKMRIEPFQPAEQYFPAYVQRKFGQLPGFRLISTETDQQVLNGLQQRMAQAGINARPTAAKVRFAYMEGAQQMNGLLAGVTTDAGRYWNVTLYGISTSGDPDAYVPMLNAMDATRQMNPQWKAEQDQRHQAQMAQIEAFGRQLTAQHNANMAQIQQSAAIHQQRMAAIQAQGDASTQAFNNRMASGDAQQQRFLNYINDENTVVGASGRTMQVDNSYQRYYVNKQTNTYIGGDITMDQDKLRSLGLNPDDYEEMQIKR